MTPHESVRALWDAIENYRVTAHPQSSGSPATMWDRVDAAIRRFAMVLAEVVAENAGQRSHFLLSEELEPIVDRLLTGEGGEGRSDGR